MARKNRARPMDLEQKTDPRGREASRPRGSVLLEIPSKICDTKNQQADSKGMC